MYILNQFTESDQRYHAYGVETYMVVTAKDRRAYLQGIDDYFILSVQRYGMPLTRLYMSEKMFHMVRDLMLKFDPRKTVQVGGYTVPDGLFDGDFLVPGALSGK